jgi:transcriptional regulator with XRE-family HTH domain
MIEADDGHDGHGGRLDARAYFGREVRLTRESLNLTQEYLAKEAGYQRPYVSKVEGGRQWPSRHFAVTCDRVFGTPGSFVRWHERLSKELGPEWFASYLDLEREAVKILDYSPLLLMGMLQTEEYATATFRSTHPRESVERIEALVELRRARRELMERTNPPLLWVVLHEACLRTQVGGRSVMLGQLRSLLEDATNPHVTLQVLTFAQGSPAVDMPFTLLEAASGDTSLYFEGPVDGRPDDSPTAVATARDKYDRLRAVAMSPEDSLSYIRQVMKEYEG